MSFLKPSVFVKLFLIFCAISAATLLNSCKQLASFDPGVDGARVVTNKTFSAPTGLTATQGRKQKITLEWIPVSGARYYDIYSAESATAEFKKIGETAKNSFDDKVSAGKTLYYKVCAVKSNYTQSAFSATVKGTSLAQPIISGGNVDESSATISWFMENSRSMNGENNYEDQLSFEVFCERGSDIKSETLSASDLNYDYKYTFAGLAGATNYQFYIRAYNYVFDQQNYEESAKVNNATLTSYMPLAPKFNVSEGESAKGIRLYIELPEKVMVNTVTKSSSNEKVDEPYPLYFKIYRRVAEGGGDFTENDFVSNLYYNGSTEPPAVADYSDSNKGYKAGDTIEWFDDEAKLQGGVKYEYMIRSYPDKNYDTVVCPENTGGTGTVGAGENGTTLEKATTAIGWKSAHPSFKLEIDENGGKTLSADKTKVLSYEFGFSAEWNDLGKAGDYRFAIKQNRKPLDAKESDSGTDSWLENKKDGNVFFDTLDEINSHLVKFGSESGLSDGEKGVYSYTLYIVPKTETEIDESKVLDNVEALDTIQVTEDVNLPKASLDVEDGYTNKVVLKISSFDENDADVTYKITRTILEGSGTGHDFDNLDGLHKSSDGVYEDTTVQGNCRYSYVLTATNPSGAWAKSQSKEAETLGKPDDVSFNREALAYDSIEISFYGVLAAKEYTVTLGESGGFGGGKTYSFAADGTGAPEDTEVKLNVNKFTVTIKQPEGYNDAKKAGISVDAEVTANSGVDNASGSVPVNVLGPALLEAKVDSSKTTDESISLTWKAVEGAKGYLIKRVMYSDAAMTKVAEGSDVTYYCDAESKAESKKVTVDGEDVGDRCKVAADASLTLTDTYMEKSGDNVDLEVYHEAQAKIAWGLPFRYVVLPVLKSDDFSFEGLKLAEGGKVAYTNLAPTAATATWGYGLNLVAEKAMSGNKQGAKWEKPHVDKAGETAYTATKPVVYRRVAGEPVELDKPVKFERFRDSSDEISSEKALMDIKPGDNAYYGAFEYIVKYYPTTGKSTDETISPPYSLLTEIAKRTTQYETPDGSMIEQDNKGYLLTIDNFSAENYIDDNKKATYYEKLSWKEWSYNTRAVGPDSMMIFIQNNNIGADPQEAVKIELANSQKTIEYKGNDIGGASLGPASVRIAPAGIVAGTKSTTDGYLKVLRDYKHNYTFELKRKISTDEGDVDISVSNKDYDTSYVKTAYRQITNEELVRAATLAMAYGIKMTGTNWKTSLLGTTDTFNESYPGNGQAKAYRKGGTTAIVKLSHNFTFTNFTPAMPTLAGEKATFLTVNGTMDGYTGDGGSEGQIYAPRKYQNGSFTVTAAEDCGGLYNAAITISSLEVNGTSGIKVKYPADSGEVSFGNITPFAFGKGNNSYSANPLAEGKAEWQ